MFDELLSTSKLALQDVDTYLFYDENRLGRAAVTRLRPCPNPIGTSSLTLVYGPPGVGKSHLALWSLSQLTERHPRMKYACTTVQTICGMIDAAEQKQSLAELIERFRTLHVLVCEDFHWLEHAPIAQKGFLILLDAMEEGQTKILATSCKSVGEMRQLDQRIISRFHGGLCVRMPLPGLESRIQLFQNWFRELKLPILKPFAASARYLAEQLPLSPSELRQTVLELAQRQRQSPCPIDVAYLKRWLSKDNRSPKLSIDAIVLQVAKEFGVEPIQIRSRSRQQGLAIPRQCAMWLARELTGRPLELIGEYFDRSHTTVSHSLSRLKDQMPKNPSLRQQVQKLRQQLNELPREDCA